MVPNPKEQQHTDRLVTLFRAIAVLISALLLAYWVYATTVNSDS